MYLRAADLYRASIPNANLANRNAANCFYWDNIVIFLINPLANHVSALVKHSRSDITDVCAYVRDTHSIMEAGMKQQSWMAVSGEVR